jgi:hypothetical protein
MNEREFDQRLQTFYRAEVTDAGPAPVDLWNGVWAIPDVEPRGGRLNQRHTALVLVAAAMLTVLLIGSTILVMSGLIRPPWVPEPRFDDLSTGLMPGVTYDSGSFGEPFTFVMPPVDGTGANYDLPDQFARVRPVASSGFIIYREAWWSIRFVDDLPIGVDLCSTSGALLPDVPATPAEVGAWLEAEQFRRVLSWIVSAPVLIPVDGRLATRWDLAESAEDVDCNPQVPARGNLPNGEEPWGEMLLRVYAIPTGDDTILLIGGSDAVNFETVAEIMDGIVRTMDFQ